jgi:hypothetical protein
MGRVVRGGSWANNNPQNYRAANRNRNNPHNRNNNIGFRVVVVPQSFSAAVPTKVRDEVPRCRAFTDARTAENMTDSLL